MSCFRRSDGRLLIHVELRQRSVAKANRLADLQRRDRADVLGDLVARQLPELLAITARALLTESTRRPVRLDQEVFNSDPGTEATTPPAGTDGVGHLNALTTQATPILPPGDLQSEDASGGSSPV